MSPPVTGPDYGYVDQASDLTVLPESTEQMGITQAASKTV